MKISFHHINLVSKNLEELNNFYKNILKLDSIPEQQFPRTEANQNKGYDGKIKFVTDGNIQLHLAEKDLTVAEKNKKHINPVEKGHIAICPFSTGLICFLFFSATVRSFSAKCNCIFPSVTNLIFPSYPLFWFASVLGNCCSGMESNFKIFL